MQAPDSRHEKADVVIVGGGPGGMQAALVLARTRKKIVVFDDPNPPRNAASHGVHNFLGVEGLLPAQVRDLGWKQIAAYQSAELRQECVTEVQRAKAGSFLVVGDGGSHVLTRKLVLAFGYHDEYPEIEGHRQCWADTIIPCPFCDGFENRDRKWGVVPGNEMELEMFPKIALNWASSVEVFVPPELTLISELREAFEALGIAVQHGAIAEIHHRAGKLQAVTLDSGDRREVATLWWVPERRRSPLLEALRTSLDLQVMDDGTVQTDETFATSIPGIWAVGDLKGWVGGLNAAAAGNVAATAIVRRWFG